MLESIPLLTPHQLKSLHRGTLLLLAAIALLIVFQPGDGDSVPPAHLSVPALALGVGMVFSRALSNSQKMPARVGPWLFALGLLCAVLVGLLGLAAALQQGATRAGLGFALGALILALRPPRFSNQGGERARGRMTRRNRFEG